MVVYSEEVGEAPSRINWRMVAGASSVLTGGAVAEEYVSHLLIRQMAGTKWAVSRRRSRRVKAAIRGDRSLAGQYWGSSALSKAVPSN